MSFSLHFRSDKFYHSKGKVQFFAEIIKQEKTFLDLVESLEPFLTSSELNRHITGVNVLATVLKQLQRDSFSTSELDFVAQFFCAQIKQHHSFITSGLKGLYYLVSRRIISICWLVDKCLCYSLQLGSDQQICKLGQIWAMNLSGKWVIK